MDRDTTHWVLIIIIRLVHAAFIVSGLFLIEAHMQRTEHVGKHGRVLWCKEADF